MAAGVEVAGVPNPRIKPRLKRLLSVGGKKQQGTGLVPQARVFPEHNLIIRPLLQLAL
jgi:hypothetical protein